MGRFDSGVSQFKVFEDVTTFYGLAEITLPEVSTKTEEISGAGILGSFNMPFIGHVEPMSITINFRSVTKDAIRLMEPRKHQLEFRALQQYTDNNIGTFGTDVVKHVVMAMPTKFTPGKLAPASPADCSGEFSVTYLSTTINGEKVLEIDTLNNVYFMNGVNYLQSF